ncbi:MAG: hypothetical protein ACI82G_001661 [Bradymonadia bacterium]|jgi:hypothetical protein
MTWHGPPYWWRLLRRPLLGAGLLALLLLRAEGPRSFAARPAASWVGDLAESERIYEGVDIARVHAVHLPLFWIAEQRLPSRTDHRDPVFLELYDAVARDRVLAHLVVRWRDELRATLPSQAEIRQIEDDWNAVMLKRGLPWTVRTPLDDETRRWGHVALSYYVERRDLVDTEAGGFSVLYARRADRLNIREGYFGWSNPRTGEALVVLDRVAGFARADIWPLMDPQGAAFDESISVSLGIALRAEVARVVAGGNVEALADSARVRSQQLRIMRDVNARAECGSRLVLDSATTRGPESAELRALRSHLSPVRSTCPELTQREWELLRVTNRRLEDAPQLDAALDELTWVAAGIVADHELQHLVDDTYGLWRSGEIPGQAGHAAHGADHEASAYLGAIHRSETPYLALLMACRVATAGPQPLRDHVRRALIGVDSAHCAGAAPQHISERAYVRWEQLFE